MPRKLQPLELEEIEQKEQEGKKRMLQRLEEVLAEYEEEEHARNAPKPVIYTDD